MVAVAAPAALFRLLAAAIAARSTAPWALRRSANILPRSTPNAVRHSIIVSMAADNMATFPRVSPMKVLRRRRMTCLFRSRFRSESAALNGSGADDVRRGQRDQVGQRVDEHPGCVVVQ